MKYNKIALVFPGQDSRYVGMGKELYDKFKYVKSIYDKVKWTPCQDHFLVFDVKLVEIVES